MHSQKVFTSFLGTQLPRRCRLAKAIRKCAVRTVSEDKKQPATSSGSESKKPLRESHEFLGDVGARDPFASEIESNFGDKVLGNADTEHLIAPPDKIKHFVGLSSKKRVSTQAADAQLLDEESVNRLKNQAPGWQVVEVDGKQRIRQEWKARNFVKGLEIFQRIAAVAEEQGHHPDLHLEGYNKIRVELWSHTAGGLTENDFIMASLINQIDLTDLKKKEKPKFWA